MEKFKTRIVLSILLINLSLVHVPQTQAQEGDDFNLETELGLQEEADSAPTQKPKAQPTPPRTKGNSSIRIRDAEESDDIKLDDDESVVEEKAPEPPKVDPALKAEKAPPPKVAPPEEVNPEPMVGREQEVPSGPDGDEFEERLFKIFNAMKPIPEEAWSKAAGKRSSEKYKIQKGDTLWDISRTLFGDPYYWPKVWALNDDISNPHFVQPGYTLNFYSGSAADEPTVDITVNQPAPPVLTGPITPDKEEELEFLPGSDDDYLPTQGLRAQTTEEVIIPAPRTRSTPTLRVIPPSLPIWEQERSQNSAQIIFSGKPLSQPKETIVPLPAFIAENFPQELGHVVEFKDSGLVGSNFNYSYVEMKNGQVGQKYLIVRELEKPRQFYKNTDGVPVSIDGEIKLVEKMRGDIYRGIITAAVSAVKVGDKLIAERLPKVALSSSGPRLQVQGSVVGGYMDGLTEMFGVGSFVFLDKGTADGMQVGGIAYVLANEKLRNKSTVDEVNNRGVGTLKIVHATKGLATAVVVAANDAVMVGDFLGVPGILNEELEKIAPLRKGPTTLLEEMEDEELKLEESKSAKAIESDDDVDIDDPDEEE